MARVMAKRRGLLPEGKPPVLPWSQPLNDVLSDGGDWDVSDGEIYSPLNEHGHDHVDVLVVAGGLEHAGTGWRGGL